MKKIFMLGLVFTLLLGLGNIHKVFAQDTDINIIKEAISKYKNKNYVGCISDLRMYTKDDPTSAISWYYLGNAYMNIAMKQEAHEAFEKVIALNTVPKLTSYSIQAQICMENPQKCEYQNFTYDEIKKLKADPTTFLEQYFANLNNTEKDADIVEIEHLINGSYSQNIHPQALEFIRQEKTKMKQNEINTDKAYIQSNEKFAQAVKLLKEQNNNVTGFAMMMDTESRQNQNNYAEIIRQYQNENKNIKPEMIQMMMMSNMMQNF